MIEKILLVFAIVQTVILPQNLDSLYNELLEFRESKNIKQNSLQVIKTKPIKCSFGLVTEVKTHLKEFSIEQQQSIQQILSRPTLQTSLVSPSGIFRIHYDTTGINIPHYFEWEKEIESLTHQDTINMINLSLDSLSIAFDFSYNYEVNILGYVAPPKDGTDGGDDKYDIYIKDYYRNFYGETIWTDKISHIRIDNSFGDGEGYYSNGISAVRVTAAHEFHHAIQVGSYNENVGNNTYYYELTSTAMEETVYDDVNDYYQYIKSYFNSTSKSFTKQTGYNLALWNIFLHERFEGNTGDEIIKRSWELMAYPNNNRAIVAIAKAMNEYGYSFKSELNKFGIWIYFVNNRTKENKYFEEAKFYPLLKTTTITELKSTNMPLTISSNPVSINYNLFLDNSKGLPDTLVAILSNSDVNGANDSQSFEYSLTIATSSFEGAEKINDNYYSKIEGTKVDYISDSYILNNELASDFIESTKIDYAYPQPFNYQAILSIPTYADISGKAEMNIYSADMNLVYSDKKVIAHSGNIVVKWNGLDANNKKLASGVYIFVTKAGDKIKKGKIVILNKDF